MARHLPEFASPEEIKAIERGEHGKDQPLMKANCGGAIPHAAHSWNSGAPGNHKWWCDGTNRTRT